METPGETTEVNIPGLGKIQLKGNAGVWALVGLNAGIAAVVSLVLIILSAFLILWMLSIYGIIGKNSISNSSSNSS